MVEKQTGMNVIILRPGNGRECENKNLKSYLVDNEIFNQTTVCYTLAERLNRTLVEKARSMLGDIAARQHLTILRIELRPRPLTKVTTEQAWCETKIYLSHFRVSGCGAFVRVSTSRKAYKVGT